MKAVSPTGVSQSSGYVKADTPAAPDPTPTPTPTPTSTPEPEPELETDPADQAPTGLSAALAEGGGVALSWTAPVEDADSVTGYEILRAAGEGEMATLASDTASTATTYTDATATEAGQTYAYQVKAIRGQARSQGSNRVALVPVEPPATPENLAPSNLTFEIQEKGVALAWDAPPADADSVTGYRVVRHRPNQGENEWVVWKWDTGSTETTYRDGYAQTHGEYYCTGCAPCAGTTTASCRTAWM